MTSSHVRQAAGDCVWFLRGSIDGDWNSSVPGLDFSVLGVVSSPADVVETLAAYAEIVAAVIETTPSSARGFHPFGMADPSGFAAMACDEMLIHTDDAARGLGLAFHPDPDLAVGVLQRLFPWVTNVIDPWEQLRWANGRNGLSEQPRLSGWGWHCAPLEE